MHTQTNTYNRRQAAIIASLLVSALHFSSCSSTDTTVASAPTGEVESTTASASGNGLVWTATAEQQDISATANNPTLIEAEPPHITAGSNEAGIEPSPNQTITVQASPPDPQAAPTITVTQTAPVATPSNYDGLPEPGTGCFWTSGTSLYNFNIRSNHSSGSELLGAIPENASGITFEACANPGWVRAEYNGIFGWVNVTPGEIRIDAG